ncbi:conjugal transfer protein [Listeria booriae]|uniref:conjugal transfer protein n=1 Tax=Listeria booriae TaxID=1552123 RepID=UPI00162914DF|nr:conjugal transfer protein [Listeria booriae]MBC2369709.1 conjugal transfer protein [Listeria booriae]
MARKKEAYNFKEAFEIPFVIRKITDRVYLPNGGARLSRIIIFVMVLFVLWMLRDVVDAIGELIPGLSLVLYLAIPWFVSDWMLKIQPDGKKLHYYLYDYAVYLVSVKLPKKRYANDQEVKYMDAEQEFEPLFLEQKVRE